MNDFSTWDIASNLLLAARWTIALSLIAFVGGGLVGLALLAMRVLGNMSGRPALTVPVKLYVDFFQGTPLLMQMFLIFFGLGLFGVNVSPLAAAAISLTLFSSAFLTEIWRGCVEAIPRGQWLAGASMGLTTLQQLRYVIWPQALKIAIAPTVGFSVQVVKGTSVASIIGFVETTKAGTMIVNATFAPFTVYAMVAALYFCLCFPLSWWAKRLERGMAVAH